MNRKVSDEQYEEAKRLWAEGKLASEISKTTGINLSTLVTYTSRRREDFPPRYSYVDDETLEDAFDMRCNKGYTFALIADRLEVPRYTVIYWFTRGRLGKRYREFQKHGGMLTV